jgi:plastocyanin
MLSSCVDIWDVLGTFVFREGVTMNRKLVLAVVSVLGVVIGSSAVSAAEKTIEAIIDGGGNPVWQPMNTPAAVGDEVEWKLGNGPHGVRITNWSDVKDHVEVVTVMGQQPFDATRGRNVNSTDVAGKVLLRLKIKSIPANGRIEFNCIVHGSTMAGTVSFATAERVASVSHEFDFGYSACDTIYVVPCVPSCQRFSCRPLGLFRRRCR